MSLAVSRDSTATDGLVRIGCNTMNYEQLGFDLAQNGHIELAMTAWTMSQYQKPQNPVVQDNLNKAEAWMSQYPKEGFLSGDGDKFLLDHLLRLQKQIGNTDNLQTAINGLAEDWQATPERNLYAWTLGQIREGQGSAARILVLSAIGEYLEQGVTEKIGTTPTMRI